MDEFKNGCILVICGVWVVIQCLWRSGSYCVALDVLQLHWLWNFSCSSHCTPRM